MIRIKNLKECQGFLEVLQESLVSSLIVVDSDRQIRFFNESYKALFHNPADEIEIPGQSCDGVSGCNACKLRDSMIETLVRQVPVDKERLTRKFLVNNQEVVKYFIYSTRPVLIGGKKMVLVVLDETTELVETKLEVKQMTITDGLTQLYNHKLLYRKLEEEWTRTRRYGNQLSLIVLDVDFFRVINDTFGHHEGDRTLVTISRLIKKNMRDIDLAGRYDSEEFMVILPQTSLENAFHTAERIRAAIASHSFEEKELKVTISAGVVEFQTGDESPMHLLNRAENLLYKAKHNGRNRVEK
ncbi:MAG: GGDEF domain-containing protein [bacterium]|nr:GGDEF domain-containing protein [bacterium]